MQFQNSLLESSCVVVARIENYNTSNSLKVSSEKSQILSCDTLVANELYMILQRTQGHTKRQMGLLSTFSAQD
jgi:hypothetical protein